MTTTATASMTTKQVAIRLKELCSEGEFEQAQRELFAEDAISIEPEASNGFAKETHGLQNIIEKGHRFQSMVEKNHAINVSDPLIAGNSMVCLLIMDVTMKGRPREVMSELCLYKVNDGKIVSEEFFM